MAKQPTQISVVIPHLNQPDLLALCLKSLQNGTRLPDEVIVVDNGSAQLPQAVCDAFPGTRLLQEVAPGPGLARNHGIANSTGDIVAFIDADCIASPQWLAVAEAEMSDPKASILGGDVRIGCADPDHPTMTEAYESIYAYRMDRYIAKQGFTGTGNLIVRRTVLEDVGPFAGITVAEDRDWGHRATAKGYSIRFVANMKVYHPARPNFQDLFVKWDRHMAHDYQRASEHMAGKVKWAAKMVAMVASPLIEGPRILLTDRISGRSTRWRAFAGLARIRLHRARRMASLLLYGDHAALSGQWNRPDNQD